MLMKRIFYKMAMFVIGALVAWPLGAAKNRYGMSLTGDATNYRLADSASICPLITGGCNALPADAFLAYTDKAKLISASDYTNCTTTRYTFKTYADYVLEMEVDLPKSGTGPFPFIIFVHGGGWGSGSYTAFENQSKYMASRGIAGVRITYTLTTKGGTFNQGLQELAEAYAFVKAHAAEWHLDMQRYGYAGGSAGTPLASLAAMKQNGNGCRLYIGCNGIYDFEHHLDGWFGKSSAYLSEYPTMAGRSVISAINFIPAEPANIPAVAVFHGTADFTISYQQSVAFCEAVANKGGRTEQNIYPYYVHGFFNKNSSDRYETVTIRMYEFAKSVFDKANGITANPAGGRIYTSGHVVHVDGFENAGLEIFNLMGYRLSTITHLGRNHKVPNMAYGSYILKVADYHNVWCKKLVVY